jgi:hypothetical protein
MWCNGIVGLPLAIVICTWKSRIVSLCISFKFVLLYVKGLRLILPTKLVTESPENCQGKVPLTWQDLRSRKTRRPIILEILCFDFAGWVRGQESRKNKSFTSIIKRNLSHKKPLSEWPKHLKKFSKLPRAMRSTSTQAPGCQFNNQKDNWPLREWSREADVMTHPASVESIHWINSQPKPGKKKKPNKLHIWTNYTICCCFVRRNHANNFKCACMCVCKYNTPKHLENKQNFLIWRRWVTESCKQVRRCVV